MKRSCPGRSDNGAPCRRSARDGFATCARHDPAYIAPVRKPRAPKADPTLLDDHAVKRRARQTRRAERGTCGPIESTASAVSLAHAPAGRAAEPVEAVDASLLVLRDRGVELHACEWRQLAERAREMGGVDAHSADTPYSERTHAGHDSGVHQTNADIYAGKPSKRTPTLHRNELAYSFWTDADVHAYVAAWAPLTRGWFWSLTDHVLAPAWAAAMEAAGRYVFAPLACVDVGSRIRLVGDGPSNWTTWLVVSRPRTREFRRWGTLDGAYIVPPGSREQRRTGVTSVVGGKPLWLMRALVRDYTRPGDLVCDPCAGAGTLGVACIAEGRRALLGDRDAAHVEIARKRLLSCPGEQRRLTLDVDAKPMTQASLLETGS